MSDNGACTRVAPDRGLEIMSAALMALATVLSAWCAYQATRWDGIQTSRANTHEATSASVQPGTLWTGPQLDKQGTGRPVARREVG
jgi:hypothetical protein